ncbi:MAG: 6-phospho-3-hexuloisomerase, partial [Candidatus Methanomethylicota archaeon]
MCDIADYIRRITDKISDEQVEQVVSILTDAASKSSKVLVTGAGRSGLV